MRKRFRESSGKARGSMGTRFRESSGKAARKAAQRPRNPGNGRQLGGNTSGELASFMLRYASLCFEVSG